MKIDDYNSPGVVGYKVFNTLLNGVSSFYRLGEMLITLENNNVIISKLSVIK